MKQCLLLCYICIYIYSRNALTVGSYWPSIARPKHVYEIVAHTNPNDHQPFVNTEMPYYQIQELKLILMISKSSVSFILPWRSPTLVQPSNSYRPRFDEKFLDATLKFGCYSLVASNVFIMLYFFVRFIENINFSLSPQHYRFPAWTSWVATFGFSMDDQRPNWASLSWNPHTPNKHLVLVIRLVKR